MKFQAKETASGAVVAVCRKITDFNKKRMRRSRRRLFRFLFGHQKGSGERGRSPEYTDVEIKNKKAKKKQLPNIFVKPIVSCKTAEPKNDEKNAPFKEIHSLKSAIFIVQPPQIYAAKSND